MKHNKFLGKLIATHIEPAVVEVRNELAKKYNVTKGPERNYTGLCDEAISLLQEKINEMNNDFRRRSKGILIALHIVHGEQMHRPRTRREYWALQHTWCYLKIWHFDEEYVIYVDPTSSQFGYIYHDIPDYYIARKPPKWYLPDRENPRFNGFTKWIDNHLFIKVKAPTLNDNGKVVPAWHHCGLIEWFQYELWGRISDMFFWTFTYSTYYKY